MEMKKCTKCGELKPKTLEFWQKDKYTKDGFVNKCKQCCKSIYIEKHGTPHKVNVEEGYKFCNKCKTIKPIEEFGIDRSTNDGYRYSCKECQNLYERQKREMKSLKPKAKEGFKFCTKCGQEFPATNEYFRKNKKGKSGLSSVCKKCKYALEKEYLRTHEEIKIRRYKKYMENNLEKIHERANQYRKDNLEVLLERERKFREEHRDTRAQNQRDYYSRNRNEIAEREKINRLKPCRIEVRKEYLKRNKDKLKIYRREYQRKNVKKRVIYNQNRRSKKLELPHDLSLEQWEKIKLDFNNKCCYCGECKPLEKEHFIPLTKGGEFTKNNIIPACKSCNSSKHNYSFRSWYKKQLFYSKEREKIILKYLGYKEDKQQLKLI